MGFRVGIDVGGTFTDLFLHDSESGRFWIAKVPTTTEDQSRGVLEAISEISDKVDVSSAGFETVLHGTTVATNAVLEGKGARVGLLVTEGWRYILHLAESWTPGPLFGFFSYMKPEPLVPYEDIREVAGRLDARGEALAELDVVGAKARIDELLESGVDALTICFMNSHANPEHEQKAKSLALERIGELDRDELPVSTSFEITPEFREYERVVTTIMNSYIGPIMRGYLTNLRNKLDEEGNIQAPLQIVRSDGGLMSLDAARELPVQTILSGPSGGVKGAAFIARRAGFEQILTLDMGGTSADVAVCFDGTPTVARETHVGSFPVRAPSVEVETIGAGGGSIASVSPVTGALRVGPESAGAIPGPACYGRGGTEPTVTDAHVVLGYLPSKLLGGAMELDVEAAYAAVQKIAEELGTDVHRAASGIIDIVNENMRGALRVVTVQKGLDPKAFSLVAFGGAGALHANALAATLGCFPVIIPPEPGVLSALGFVAADVRNEFSQTFIRTTDRSMIEDARAALENLGDQGREWLTGEGISQEHQTILYVIDMRYYRQGYEIPIEVSEEELGAMKYEEIADRFKKEHERLYGFSLPGLVELVNLRARAIGQVQELRLETKETGEPDPSSAQVSTQETWSNGNSHEIPLYDRTLLMPGMQISGPAVVVQYDATTQILADHTATVDAWLNLVIEEK